MKKLLAILLSMLLLCTMIPFATVSADSDHYIELVADAEEVNAGDEITVEVSLYGHEDIGLIFAQVELGFDPNVFELVTTYDEDEEMWMPPIEVASKFNASSNKYILFSPIDEETGAMERCLVQFMRSTASATQAVKENLFYTVTFKVKDDAISGNYDISVINYNEKYTILHGNKATEYAHEPITITVNGTEPPHVCDFAGVETQAPTCGEPGVMTYTCECGETYTEEIPATNDHEYDNDCDADCNVCGALREVGAHDYQITEEHPANCGKDGWIIYTCSICGDSYDEGIDATGNHVYDNDCDNFCNVCDCLRDVDHNWVDATCTTPKTCSKCGVTDGEALGHDYAAATCTKAKTCKVCGATSGKANGHKYSNACDASCNVCKATRSISHTYAKKVTKATLTKDGVIKNVCSKCGYTASKTTAIYKASKISLSKTSYTYNGKAQKPSVVVKDSKGKTIASSNYTVKYASGLKKVGTYKVTITFKGNYSGTKTLTYKINPVKTTVKATAAKKSLKLTIGKKTTEVTGYEVQYSTSKSFKSYKTKKLTSYKKTSLTLTGLKAKTTYYVRVRTYKTVNGVKYYSGWSTIAYKKTK